MVQTSSIARGVASAERGRFLARYRGEVAGHRLWTDEEVRLLKTLYPAYDELRAKLKGRTYYAIRGKAYGLGIQNKRHVWTMAELSRLRKLYAANARPAEMLAAFPGQNMDRIKRTARYHGIARRRGRLKSTGYPVIDDIRERAFVLGYSMVDLDKEARTGTYFQKACWLTRTGESSRRIARAIKFLGGVLRAEWTQSLSA